MSNNDYKYETERYSPIDFLIDTPRIRLFKSYHKIDSILDSMDEALRRAGEHPAQLSKDHATRCQFFLETVGDALQEYEYLFNEMDE